MGTWGNGPFDNDEILDILGGFRTPQYLLGAFESALYNDYVDGAKAVIAVIHDSFNTSMKNINTSITDADIVKTVKAGYIEKEMYNQLCETTNLLISTYALSINDRVDYLKSSINITRSKIYRDIGNNMLSSIKEGKAKPLAITESTLKMFIEIVENRKIRCGIQTHTSEGALVVSVIQKITKGNKVIGLRVRDMKGNEKDLAIDTIEKAVKNKQICIV